MSQYPNWPQAPFVAPPQQGYYMSQYPNWPQAPFVAPPQQGYYMPQGPNQQSRALIAQPDFPDLAGDVAGPNGDKWYRAPFYPTAPFIPYNPNVGMIVRHYSGGITGEAANAEVIRNVPFDIPCRLIAINGAAVLTTGGALPVGRASLDTFLFRLAYTTGERLDISERLGSTVCGTAERPGELGHAGWSFSAGSSVQLGITPLLADLRIDIVLVCLEMRGASNYAPNGG